MSPKKDQGCKSCKRAQIKCHGYRNVPQTMFYHETDEVISKNRNSTTEASQSAERSLTVHDASTLYGASSMGSVIERIHIPPNLADFAFNYFRAYHFLLPDLPTSPNQDMLSDCMKAHGLASCAVTERCSRATLEARRHYLSAIQKVDCALRDSCAASDDSVLLAVMMLGSIEAISDTRPVPLDAWKSHVEGCTAMLKLRGPRQVQTAQGRLLFMQAASSLMSQCLFTSRRMPDVVQTLTDEAAKYMTGTDSSVCEHPKTQHETDSDSEHANLNKATWAMHQALLTLTNFNSDIKRCRVDNPMHMSGQILQQDEQLNAAQQQAALGMGSCTDASTSTPMAYEEAFDQYLAIQTANTMRSCRLLLHVMNQQVLAPDLLTDATREVILQASSSVINDMRSQILESIPYQVTLALNWLDRPNVPSGFPNLRQLLSPPAGVSTAVFVAAEQILTGSCATQPTFFTDQDPPILRISHGYNIIAALLLVGCVSTPGSPERKSTCDMLRLVGESLSVPQAIIFAQRLAQSDGG
ncbi:hypothetical protein PRZ48_014464 [Zasmidium cellare]|uniref:Uncharacterized protein n=1 Tax=Zasmidium cellare TaxID=395010 RepID=A0ABR0DYT3_ZASCE|nr:hypothetical protein PRZ48_014464 [Zasmidium cellare]